MIEGFVGRRRSRWDRLSELLDGASSARRSLSIEEIDELASLYRRTTSDLAIARRDFPEDRITLFLNELVTRAHALVYRDSPAPLSRLRRFFLSDFPREYRASWPYLVAAAALFFAPMLAAVIAILMAPDAAQLLVPASVLADIKAGETWFDIDFSKRPYAAAFIMTNNMQVSFLALGAGMLGGVGTVFVLAFNGLSIGGITGALSAHGLADRLFGFVSPHGFLELSAIVIAGACGLMLGKAIVWAGFRPRREALVEAGGRSVRLLTGSQPFLVAAGLLEGFVSPADFPWPFKLAIGLGTVALMYSYLLLFGRIPRRRASRAAPSPNDWRFPEKEGVRAAPALSAPGSD